MSEQVIDFRFRVEVRAPSAYDAKTLSHQISEALERLPIVSDARELKWVRLKSGKGTPNEVQLGE